MIGRLLAAHAERIAAQAREAERELAELTGRVSGPVRLSAFQSVMAVLIAPTLLRLADAYPAIVPGRGGTVRRWPRCAAATSTSKGNPGPATATVLCQLAEVAETH
jgi:hypothetical protein